MSEPLTRSWRETLKTCVNPKVLTMLMLGIFAGLPLLLIFSSLSLWLREAGVARATVTYFSWAALGYSFKFIWAPLVDVLPLPLLTAWLGRRRAWLLLAQLMIATAIAWMAMIDPASHNLSLMAFAAVMLGFSAATQDIVIDAYRIELVDESLQALMSATYVAGYRVGMLLSGAGALFFASWFGSSAGNYSYHAWQYTYLIMSGFMILGMLVTLIIKEPNTTQKTVSRNAGDYLGLCATFIIGVTVFVLCFSYLDDVLLWLTRGMDYSFLTIINSILRFVLALILALGAVLLCVQSGWVNRQLIKTSYLFPIKEFFQRYGWQFALLLLSLIGLYRISDIVLGVIANVFYLDMGFTKPEIATVVKTFGLLMTILGGFLGGVLAMRFSVMKTLFLGALMSAVTNLLFMILANMGHNVPMLYLVISADNLSGGIASAAFVAFLSRLTNVSFTAVQYAIFSSLMTLIPKILGGYSGTIVDIFGYQHFFIFTAVLGLPVLILVYIAAKIFRLRRD